MSNKIYICKNFIKATQTTLGLIQQNISLTDKLATKANNLTLNSSPNLVQLTAAKYDGIKALGLDIDARGFNTAYLSSLRLRYNNTNSEESYKASKLYTDYRHLISFQYPVQVSYLCNGITYYDTITVSWSATEVPVTGYGRVPITEQFSNIKWVETGDDAFFAAFSGLQIENKTPAIQRIDGKPLTTAEAVELLKTVHNIPIDSFEANPIIQTTTTTLFSGTLPDSSREGKILLTYLNIEELPDMHCLYAYQGNTSYTPITTISEPYSLSYLRSQSTMFDVYECIEDDYRDNSNYLGLVGQNVDSVSSSFRESYVSVPVFKNNTLSFTNLGMTWDNLERIAWLDCALLRCTFSPSNRTTTWISVAKCLKDGIPTQVGETNVSIEMVLPDLCTITAQGNTTPTLQDFSEGFYPYNPLAITLEMGYQTNCINEDSNTLGFYIGTKRAKRIFINQKELEYFVVGEEDTLNKQTISNTTGSVNTGGTYPYKISGTLNVGKAITSATISQPINGYAEISYTYGNTYIDYVLYSTTPSRSVTTIIMYTCK